MGSLCATAQANTLAHDTLASGTGPWQPSAGITAAETAVVRQRLVASHATATPGQTLQLAWEFALEPGWHIYWQNAGDSGLPPELRNSAKQVLPLTYPVPEIISMPPVTNYGYHHAVTFTAPWTIPHTNLPGAHTFTFKAEFLYCKDICLPGTATLELPLTVGAIAKPNPAFTPQQNLAQPLPGQVTATVSGRQLHLTLPPALATAGVRFIPQEDGLIDDSAPQTLNGHALMLSLDNQQSHLPTKIVGLLLSPNGQGFTLSSPLVSGAATAPAMAPQASAGWALLVAMAGALLAGLILNLMPCVLPVLSLKLLGLAKYRSGAERVRHSLAYAAGVLAAFWALAGVIILIQAGGAQVGWGFQLQEPWVVASLTLLMVALALNFWGVFTLGAGLTQLAGVGQPGRLMESAASGLLAVVVATPCTVPFMGGAVAYALTQPWPLGLMVFSALGLGMASPFLLLALVPSGLKFIPKPGIWMLHLKHYLGWPMLATALWLVGVYYGLTHQAATFGLLGVALGVAFGLWFYGQRPNRWRGAALGLILLGGMVGLQQLNKPPLATWQPWSPSAVANAQASQRPVFIDFTADWCLTCKFTEATVLNTAAAQALFAQHRVVLLRADWTRRDDAITAELAKFGRKGVPLYLLYRPGVPEPEILPQLLTVGLLQERLAAPAAAQP